MKKLIILFLVAFVVAAMVTTLVTMQPWLSPCERFQKKCVTAMQSGTNLKLSLACSAVGILTATDKMKQPSQEECQEVLDMIDKAGW